MGDSGGNSRTDSPENRRDSNKSSQIESPPSVSHSLNRSTSSSPLLDTVPLPLDHPTTCPYCHRDYRNPRVLDCLHSMCEDCIIAQLDGRRDGDKGLPQQSALEMELETPERLERPTPPGVIRCPICAQESHVGNDVRYVHGMLIDFVRRSEVDEQRGTEKKCRACKSEQSAVAVCKQCASDLCPTCVQAHRNMRMFDGHQVMSYDELDSSGQRSEARMVLCPAHAQPYKMLCATCETLGCKVCLESDHVNHKLIEVNSRVVSAIQHELRDMYLKVEKKWNDSITQWEAIPDRHLVLQQQYEEAKAKIDISFEEIVKAVEEMRLKKLEELETYRDSQEELITDLYKKVDLAQSRVSDAVQFAERLVNKANGMELLASRRKVIQQLTNLQHTLPVLTTQYELEYQPLSKKHLDTALASACGLVSGRTVSSSVKESSAAAVSASQHQGMGMTEADRDKVVLDAAKEAWSAAPRASSTNGAPGGPGTIGMERKKTVVGVRGEFTNGWPPSSNPPDLPSPSPPKDPNVGLGIAQNSASTGALGAGAVTSLYNNYQWNPSSVAVSSTPPVCERTAALAAAAALFPNVSTAPTSLSYGNNGAALSAATTAHQLQQAQLQQQLKAALLMQQAGSLPLGNHLLSTFAPVNGKLLFLPPLMSVDCQWTRTYRTLVSAELVPFVHQKNPLTALVINVMAAARLRGLGIDPLVGIGGLSLDANSLQRTAGADAMAAMGTKVHTDLKMHSVFGTGSPGNSLRELHTPGGFCLSDNDDILIADTNNHRIIVCGPPHPWTFGNAGQADGCLCFPRKVVAIKGDPSKGERTKFVVIDRGGEQKSRAQLFDHRGEFLRRIQLMNAMSKGGVDVQAACSTLAGHLVLVDHGGVVYSLDIEQTVPRVVAWFDTQPRLGEATDVAVFDKNVYITDFKNHCVHVFSMEGTYLRRLGEPAITPYPIGVDVSKTGDVLVADTHGNHLHVVMFPAGEDARNSQQFHHSEFKMSRCVGLRIASSGHLVTLSKQSHTLFVFKPLFLHVR